MKSPITGIGVLDSLDFNYTKPIVTYYGQILFQVLRGKKQWAKRWFTVAFSLHPNGTDKEMALQLVHHLLGMVEGAIGEAMEWGGSITYGPNFRVNGSGQVDEVGRPDTADRAYSHAADNVVVAISTNKALMEEVFEKARAEFVPRATAAKHKRGYWRQPILDELAKHPEDGMKAGEVIMALDGLNLTPSQTTAIRATLTQLKKENVIAHRGTNPHARYYPMPRTAA